MPFSFNADGSLNIAPRQKKDHLAILNAITDIPFGMGQKLLIDHLQGKQSAKTARLRLDRYLTHGELGGYTEEELKTLLTHLERQHLITIQREKGRYPVYTLTEKGRKEREEPQLTIDMTKLETTNDPAAIIDNPFTEPTIITDEEKALFASLDGFFDHFNDEQKKAATSTAKHILCVAGAGSGKTSVLAKRIQFLIRYRSVNPNKILAITFTRKARKEMRERLEKLLPGAPVHIETFNSFCETNLKEHGHLHYQHDARMASFKEQLATLLFVLKEHGHTPTSICNLYFTERQRNGKDPRTLFYTFAYDFHTLTDKIRLTDATIDTLRKSITANEAHAPLATLLLTLAEAYLASMKTQGLRDYTDQLVDTISLFDKLPIIIPHFEHILVDEYQDVNDQQVKLLAQLDPDNLFAVGDPRQSIYGWRGSRLAHIIDFPTKHPDTEIIQLTTNYRSTQAIVDLCNRVSTRTGYADLKAANNDQGQVGFYHHANEDTQAIAITDAIKHHPGPRKDLFVLARTNKALDKLKDHFEAANITYLLRTDELRRPDIEAQENQVTLATIHAIKGLEAATVHLLGANNTNFPCKASDHPVMELFALNDTYDTYAEELRVLYVALSRAKKALHIHYTGTISPFLQETKPASVIKQRRQPTLATDTTAQLMQLRQWRLQTARARGCPAYIICPDKTLQALIDQQPQTVDDLYAIPGLGDARIQEFGEELLLQLKKTD